MVATFLDPEAQTGLDIGSNEGALTCVLAKCGVEATGIELGDGFRDTAEILAREMGVSPRFVGKAFSLDDIDAMQPVDVSLFLSVHHQLVALHGLDYANDFLRALGRKTDMQMFFQPACIHRKYKKPVPFGDNDIPAIVAYFMDLMADIFPHRALVGYSINDVPKKEPLRPMLAFGHTPIAPQGGRDVVGLINEIERAAKATHPLLRRMRAIAPVG